MKHHQKIKYFPGLISIILLPIFCVLYLKFDYDSKKLSAISLTTWDGEFFYDETIAILNSRKFKKVVFTGDLDSDKLKLTIAQNDIKNLILNYDTLNGIQFHFENNSQYKTYIKLLEILKEENATYYIPYKNNIWLTNPIIPKNASNFVNCSFNPKAIDDYEQISKYDLFKTFIKKHTYICLIYILLFYFGIRNVFNLFKN